MFRDKLKERLAPRQIWSSKISSPIFLSSSTLMIQMDFAMAFRR
jgi:hypothetical protein